MDKCRVSGSGAEIFHPKPALVLDAEWLEVPVCGFALLRIFPFDIQCLAAAGVCPLPHGLISALLDGFQARIAEEALFFEDGIGH